MLQPKRTKFRKVHKGRNRGLAQGTDVSFGTFGLKAVGRGRLTARQIEAARRAMTRAVKRQGKIWIRVLLKLALKLAVVCGNSALKKVKSSLQVRKLA